MVIVVHRLRSDGISVFASQLPLAYAKKSSPGATALSIPPTSRPSFWTVAEAELSTGAAEQPATISSSAETEAALDRKETGRTADGVIALLRIRPVYAPIVELGVCWHDTRTSRGRHMAR